MASSTYRTVLTLFTLKYLLYLQNNIFTTVLTNSSSFFAVIAIPINVYFSNFYKSHIVHILEQRKPFVKLIKTELCSFALISVC